MLVGTSYDSSFSESAFLWSLPSGYVQLDPLSNYSEARALATNGSGNIVVGSCGSEAEGTSIACLWGESLLPIDVGGHLTSLGLDLTGWTLTNCTGVSDDGTVFTGRGIHNGVVAGMGCDHTRARHDLTHGPCRDCLQPSQTSVVVNQSTEPLRRLARSDLERADSATHSWKGKRWQPEHRAR